MTVTPLAEFRTTHSGCEIVVLADISTRTVLAWDSVLKWPQEHLDALCDLAAQVLAIDAAGAGAPAPMSAMLARDTGILVFRRAAPGADEVICCGFAPDAALAGVIDGCGALCTRLLDADDRARA